MLKATRGGEDLNKVCLPLGGTRGDHKNTLHPPHIIYTLVDDGGEGIGVLHRGELHPKEGQFNLSFLLDGQHPGDIADEGTGRLPFIEGQLYEYVVPHLQKIISMK